MAERGILPELEVFDSGMAYLAAELLDRGVLRRPLYANLILGSVNTAPATARSLAHLVDALPSDTTWAVVAQLAAIADRPLATAAQVRERLGLREVGVRPPPAPGRS